MIIVNNSCKSFPTIIFKVPEENISFSTRKTSRKNYLKSLYHFQSSNLIAFEDKLIENLFTELNLQNIKMVINCSYNPHKSEIKKHLIA